MRRILNKLYYRVRYFHETPTLIKLLYLRIRYRNFKDDYVLPSSLTLGHKVAYDNYLKKRISDIRNGTPLVSNSKIQVVDNIVINGNGRVVAHLLAGYGNKPILIQKLMTNDIKKGGK